MEVREISGSNKPNTAVFTLEEGRKARNTAETNPGALTYTYMLQELLQDILSEVTRGQGGENTGKQRERQ